MSLRGGRELVPDPLDRPIHQLPVLVFPFEPQVAVPTLVGIESLYDGSHKGNMAEVKFAALAKTWFLAIVAHGGRESIRQIHMWLRRAWLPLEGSRIGTPSVRLDHERSSDVEYGFLPVASEFVSSASLYEIACKTLIL